MHHFFRGGLSGWLATLCLTVASAMTFATDVHAGTCTVDPAVQVDEAAKDVLSGDDVSYAVTITSTEDCDVDISLADSNGDFTSAQPDGSPIAVTSGVPYEMTVTVAVAATTSIGDQNTSTLIVNGDGNATDVEVLLTTTVNNPLLHNSFNLNSTKWSGDGGWGLPGTKYGAITCATCHARNTGNIKRVRNSITTPDDTLGTFPGDGQPISLQTVIDGSADFGDDSDAHSISDRICEVCHSITKYHRYDTTGQVAEGGSLSHFNNKNCIACHAHNEGFRAGACSGCHGGGTTGSGGDNFWPDGSNANLENDNPGRHEEHMSALANLVYGLANSAVLLDQADADTKQADLCGYCHDNPGGDSDHGNPADLPAEVAMHPVWDQAAAASGSYTTGDGNCTNICHNNHPTGTGPGSWGWGFGGDATGDCIMCHNDITVTTTTTGNTHLDHTGAASDFGRNIDCDDCHDAAASWATATPPAINHLDGNLDVSGGVTLSYTGSTPPGTSYGSCNNNACHNDGTATVGNPVDNTYTWDEDGLSDCGICHLAAPTSGDHGAHVTTNVTVYGSAGGSNPGWNAYDSNAAVANAYDFGCGQCHGDAMNNHLDGGRDIDIANTGWNVASAGTCNAAYCHSHKDTDGTTTVQVTTPVWGDGFPAGDRCAQCHENSPVSAGHEEHQVGFHYDAVYSGLKDFMPVLDSDPKPIGLVNSATLDPYDTLRGHGGLLESDGSPTSTTMTCYVCHNDTVTTRVNDQNPTCGACHNDTDAPTMGDMTVADTNVHVNGQIDVVFMREKVRSKAQVRDDLFDVPELSNNWTRMNDYKLPDGSSYDESPDTLFNMAATYGGYNAATMTCMISCHLWEDGRVDKYPVHWYDNSLHGSQPIMCIDCHTRLPK